MNTGKTSSNIQSFSGVASSLERAQRLNALSKEHLRKMPEMKEDFIGIMWLGPDEIERVSKKKKNGIHQQG